MMLTKDELTAAIVASAAKLGRAPSRTELMKQAGVTQRNVRKHFGTFQRALEPGGLEGIGAGLRVGLEELFQDWTGLLRRVKQGQILAGTTQIANNSTSSRLVLKFMLSQ